MGLPFFHYPDGTWRRGRTAALAAAAVAAIFILTHLNQGGGSAPSSSGSAPSSSGSARSSAAPVNAPSQIQNVLFCQSIELYDHFVGDFDKLFIHHTPVQEFLDNSGNGKNCEWGLEGDDGDLNKHLYHIEKIERGYICVRRVTEPQCYWTDASKLRFIGHGPQLSDDQFAQVDKLFSEADRLNKLEKAYSERRDNIIWEDDGNHLRRLDPRQQREADDLLHLDIEAIRQAHELQQQALKIGSETTPAPSPSQADHPVTSSNEPTIEDHALLGGDIDDLAQRFNQQASKLEFNVRMWLVDCSSRLRASCQYQISNTLGAVAGSGKDGKTLDGVVFFFGGKDANAVEFMSTIITTMNLFAPEAGRDEIGRVFKLLFIDRPLPIPNGESRDATLRGVKFSVNTPTNAGIWFSASK